MSSSDSKEARIRRIKEEAAQICAEQRLRILADPALAELDRLLRKAEKADRDQRGADRDQRGADKIARSLLDF